MQQPIEQCVAQPFDVVISDGRIVARNGVVEGDLQIVSSDHAPYRYDETGKLSAAPDAGFYQIANGLPGLETRLPLFSTPWCPTARRG